MVFSSISFIFFLLPVFLLVDFLFKKLAKIRNIAMIVFSLIFYTWGEGINVLILIALGGFTFFAGALLFKSSDKNKKLFLFLFVCISLLTLIGFKYFYWILYNVVQGVPFLSEADCEVRYE